MKYGALVLGDIVDSFKNFNFQAITYELRFEQIVVAIVAAVLCVLFGVFMGACIFYPVAMRRGIKLSKQSQEERMVAVAEAAKETARRIQEEQRAQQVADTFDDESSFDDLDFSDDIPEAKEEEPETVAAATAVQNAQPAQEEAKSQEDSHIPALIDITPTADGEQLSESEANVRAVLQDDNFLRLVAQKEAQQSIVNRHVVLAYCSRMRPLAPVLPIRIIPAGGSVSFDRLQTGDYTFAVVVERRKVLKLYMRLHGNTVAALRAKAGDYVQQATDFGPDWYSWIVTDLPGCERLVAKVLDMSYKYVSHAEYVRDQDGLLHAKGSDESALNAALAALDVDADSAYVQASDTLNDQYRLDYFSRKDACRFVSDIKGVMTVTTQDEIASCAAILKADTHIFAIVFENCSVVKVIFRAPVEYVAELTAKHKYVGKSEFPHSNSLRWYYAILDESFSTQDCQELLRRAYDYMIVRYGTAQN